MSLFMLISWAYRAMAAHDRKGGGDGASRTSGLGENLFNSSCPKCSPPGACKPAPLSLPWWLALNALSLTNLLFGRRRFCTPRLAATG
jgi:hypothetical protein